MKQVRNVVELLSGGSKLLSMCGQGDETKGSRISLSSFMPGHFHMSPLFSFPSITFHSGQDSCLEPKHIHSSAVHQIAPNTVILQPSCSRGCRGGGQEVSKKQSCVCQSAYLNHLRLWHANFVCMGKKPNVISQSFCPKYINSCFQLLETSRGKKQFDET